eukprot:2125489-Rhodomonas_salina.1
MPPTSPEPTNASLEELVKGLKEAIERIGDKGVDELSEIKSLSRSLLKGMGSSLANQDEMLKRIDQIRTANTDGLTEIKALLAQVLESEKRDAKEKMPTNTDGLNEI